jgi:hypothetical protein
MANAGKCQEATGRGRAHAKLKVGIFGFGSLIADPGQELAEATAVRPRLRNSAAQQGAVAKD